MSEAIDFEEFAKNLSPQEKEKLSPVIIDRPPTIRARSRDLFEMEVSGEDTKALYNDDNPVHLYCVIVSHTIKPWDPNFFGRKYWENAHDPSQKSGPPNCWSSDSVNPDPSIKSPMSTQGCKLCPMAKGPNRKSQCPHTGHIAIKLVDWEDNPGFEKPYGGYGDEGGLFRLVVPNASLFASSTTNGEVGLIPFLMKLRKVGLRPNQVVVRVGFSQYPVGSKGPKKLIYPKLHFAAVGSVIPHATYPSLKDGQVVAETLGEYFDDDNTLIDETLKNFVTVSYPVSDPVSAPPPQVEEEPKPSETSHIELKSRKKAEPESSTTDILDSLLAEDGGESDDGE